MSESTSAQTLRQRYHAVRRRSTDLCAPLSVEDHVPQPIVDVSPPKWHLGHTTWFFEAFVLRGALEGYAVFHPRYAYLFNSYYDGAGDRVARDQRGALSRPTVAEVLAYRAHVDATMDRLLSAPDLPTPLNALIELGLQHEQQHQELLVTDIKYILGTQPLAPAYAAPGSGPLALEAEHAAVGPSDGWVRLPGGTAEIGHSGTGFAFDNETPRHSVLLQPFALRRTLVSNAEYLRFMADGGYQRHAFWHAEGWDWVRAQPQAAPLYWLPDETRPGQWLHCSLGGLQPLPLDAPITHISYYEAFAFCQWAGWRLPTEFEWETAAPQLDWGQRWEWTQSAYQPYPGFRRSPEVVGEYNGKFMVNQQVLRGASFATPPGHARLSYRNFFHAPLRWQYTGIRPARDLSPEEQA